MSAARALLSTGLVAASPRRAASALRPTLRAIPRPSPCPLRTLHSTPRHAASQSDGPDPRNMMPPGMEKLLDNPKAMASIEKLMQLLESKGVDVHSGKPPSMFQLAKIAADGEVRKVTGEVIRHAALAHRATLSSPSPRRILFPAGLASSSSLPARRLFSTSSRPLNSASARPASKALRKASFVRSQKDPSFVDALTLNAQAGTGGDGCVAFSRAKYVQYGPPSGGGGGKGGDVYVRAVTGLRSLARTPSRLEAGMGGHGLGDWKGGAKGRDKTINVPVGTIVQVAPAPDAEMLDPNRALRAQYEEELLERFGKKFKRMRRKRSRSASSARRHPPAAASIDDQVELGATSTSRSAEAVPLESSTPQDEAETAAADASEDEDVELAPEEADEIHDEDEVDTVPDAYDALLNRQRRDSVWRHYPGGGGGTGSPSIMGLSEAELQEESEADIAEQRREFEAAEQRLAFALFKARRDESAEDRARRLGEVRILDLDEPTPNDSPGILVAKGGTGGYGNPFFLSAGAISRSPKMATRGEPGEAVEISLELKTPADVGLIGFPNAGKSTLLRAMTGAGRGTSAKVGSYEFTTLSPNFGVVRIAEDGGLLGTGEGAILDSSSNSGGGGGGGGGDSGATHVTHPNSTSSSSSSSCESYRFTLSDLPGLILGASENRGLGHTFLRHAERCRGLFYVVDVSDERREPWNEVRILHDELEAYLPGLSERVSGVVANKCDRLGLADDEVSQEASEGQADGVEPAPSSLGSPSSSSPQERAKLKLRRLAKEVEEMHGGRRLAVLPVSAMHRMGVERVAEVMREAVRVGLERELEARE